jgi:predicted transcriptional regulator of viral defense system
MADVTAINPDIGGSKAATSPDRAAAELATSQDGVISLEQLLELRLSVKAIEYRLEVGRLHPILPGVYAVGHRVVSWRGRLMAAVLWAGEEALVSHRSAAALWEVLPSQRFRIEVVVPRKSPRSRREVQVHQSRLIHPDDRGVIDGIPVTSLPRTMLDLAEVERPRRLERALEESVRLGKLDGRKLDELLVRTKGRRGLKTTPVSPKSSS